MAIWNKKHTSGWLLTLFALLLLLPRGVVAADGKKDDESFMNQKVTAEEMYQRWAQHNPAEIVAHAKKAKDYILKNGATPQALEAFNNPGSDAWWPNRPYFSPIIVMRCDEFRDVTHPIARMRDTFTRKDSIKKFKDINGKAVFFDLCVKIRYSDKGTWVKQYNFWPGTDDPLWIAILGMPVPGTPYQLQLFYITPDPDLKMLNGLLD